MSGATELGSRPSSASPARSPSYVCSARSRRAVECGMNRLDQVTLCDRGFVRSGREHNYDLKSVVAGAVVEQHAWCRIGEDATVSSDDGPNQLNGGIEISIFRDPEAHLAADRR